MDREARAQIFDTLAVNREAHGDHEGAALARQQAHDIRSIDDLHRRVQRRRCR